MCGDGLHEWVVFDRKLQFGRRGALAMYFFLSSAAFEHADDAVVMGQGGAATQHVAVKLWYLVERNKITLPLPGS